MAGVKSVERVGGSVVQIDWTKKGRRINLHIECYR
jgi:hypothetical protein